ncbi:hypothetical protein C8024_12285 [Sphingopyxis sp. BSNA05]|nr:hypothetical protein [Sphingopyxis sp. BSNA05]
MHRSRSNLLLTPAILRRRTTGTGGRKTSSAPHTGEQGMSKAASVVTNALAPASFTSVSKLVFL